MASPDLATIIHGLPEPMLLVRPEGTIVAANPGAARLFGQPSPELVGKRLDSFVADDPDRLVRYLRLCLRSAEGIPGGFSIRTSSEQPTICRTIGALAQLENRQPALIWLRLVPRESANSPFIAYNERLRALVKEMKALQQSEERLRQVVDLAPQHVAVLGPDRSRLYINRAALDYYGLTLEEWRGSDPRRLVHPDDLERMTSETQSNFVSGSPHETEGRLLRSDGKYRWFLFRFSPERDERGRITRWYGAATDIEDRKQVEHRLQNENVALREEIDKAWMFEEIVGENPGLKRVLKQVETVAPTDATVLILGETGTGKELIARAIHQLSPRRGRTFVKLNCAAIPSGLLESELFGHEKGAFTGAIAQKIGLMELAHQGTLFLDEVGDLPLELQPKLLRALQEKEFQRLGGTRTLPIDVRLIAATNHDLAKMVSDRQFRIDLYYRLKVFPITIPPLRERPEDIPLLVRHFVNKHARRMGRRIETIPPEVMHALTRWRWPGNVRELENFMERAVILSPGPTLCAPLSELEVLQETASTPLDTTLQAAEREQIIRVLRETRGVIGGPRGAAVRLGLKRTTLNAKIRKLEINPKDYI